jgi:fibronectin type 3 domain-containing protein
LNVTFTPAAAGSVTGNVTIPSNAANSSVSIGLSGTGASNSVMLTWDPGSSSGVIGYYVFRSLAGGQLTQLTTALITATTYTDTTVQSGQTYDYAVTSVDSSNTQSAYSNVASASIP